MNESIVKISKQREKALGRWENEGGDVLPAASPDVKKAAIEDGSRKKADDGDAEGAKSGGKINRKKNQS